MGARLRYWFDGALSRGPSVVIGWLGLLTLAVVLVSALIITVLQVTGINGGGELGFAEAFWQSMLRIVDAGTFAADSGWPTRLLGLLVTLAGIFLAGSLIGLIASSVDQQIELLRKGRSAVLEVDHTLILGWSDRVPAIVRELIVANESRRRAVVVVMADVEKTEMEDTLRQQIEAWRSTRLVCRRGDCASIPDLERVNITGARSVVIVGGNDAATVKALLATNSFRTDGRDIASVVAEVADTETSASIRSLFGSKVAIVNSDAVVAELTAQACRQRGLSQVFQELLDFDGDEIYFESFPDLAGETYARAQLCFADSSLIGVLTTDDDVLLNPPADRIVAPGEQLIGVASDDSTFLPSGFRGPRIELTTSTERPSQAGRRMVLVGWSELGPRVVSELDEFLGPDTVIDIVVDPDWVDVDEVRAAIVTNNITVDVSTHRGGPEEIAAHAARTAFHEVIVLGRRAGVTSEQADATTLLTLMAFSRVAANQAHGPVRIVAELLEQRHAPLALASGADDFIVSDELTSLMMAQLSERQHLDRLFRDLFDRGGATIEVIPADRLGAESCTCFADIVAAASTIGASAIGYRNASDGRVVLNPSKYEDLVLTSADAVVVVRS